MKRSLVAAMLGLVAWMGGFVKIAELRADEPAGSTLAAPEKPATPAADAKAAAEKEAAEKKAQEDAEYYELLQLFADTLDQVERNYVKDISTRELMEAAIRGMMGKLDQHSNYIPPAEMERFKTEVESEFGGVGIQVSTEGGVLRVISPIYGTPAYKAGILAGDKIVKIEDTPTKGLHIDECIKRLKGKIGTSVTVTVEHANGGQEQTVTVKRGAIRGVAVLGDTRGGVVAWE
jgi:carboxyl-terminal processing protease